MKGVRKDMLEELVALRGRLKDLLQENTDELSRTRELLRINEQKIEDRFAQLDSFQSVREKLGRKFRKTNSSPASAGQRSAAVSQTGPSSVAGQEVR